MQKQKVSILWKETEERVAINCDVVYVRPFLPFLVRKNISNKEPLRSYEDLLVREDEFRHNDLYHKKCAAKGFRSPIGEIH